MAADQDGGEAPNSAYAHCRNTENLNWKKLRLHSAQHQFCGRFILSLFSDCSMYILLAIQGITIETFPDLVSLLTFFLRSPSQPQAEWKNNHQIFTKPGKDSLGTPCRQLATLFPTKPCTSWHPFQNKFSDTELKSYKRKLVEGEYDNDVNQFLFTILGMLKMDYAKYRTNKLI